MGSCLCTADFVIKRVADSGENLVFVPLFVRAFADVASVEYFHEGPGISNVITATVRDEFTLILIDDEKGETRESPPTR